MESASVVSVTCVNALSGMALAPEAEEVEFSATPDAVPPARTVAGALTTCEDGV